VNGSTELLSRGRQLGKVLVESNPILYPVNLIETIEGSISLVRGTFKGKKSIHDELRIVSSSRQEKQQKQQQQQQPLSGRREKLKVLADDLLQQVFVNIYSNSAKYTEGRDVEILTEVAATTTAPEPDDAVAAAGEGERREEGETEVGGRGRPFLRVSISDKGRGIPDGEKANVFSRYLKSAKGTGLGMSIVHALVVERYKGRIKVSNRVPGDFTRGTRIDLWLPRAVSDEAEEEAKDEEK
jgi:signal transduction histidine kinase